MNFLSAIKYVSILITVILVAGGLYYVTNLKADLAVSEQNTLRLNESVQNQQLVIDNQIIEIREIQKINTTLLDTRDELQNQIDELNEKFKVSANGTSRDFGDITRAKPALINKIINRASDNVNRCFELVTGAEPLEGEKNNECQDLIDNFSK